MILGLFNSYCCFVAFSHLASAEFGMIRVCGD